MKIIPSVEQMIDETHIDNHWTSVWLEVAARDIRKDWGKLANGETITVVCPANVSKSVVAALKEGGWDAQPRGEWIEITLTNKDLLERWRPIMEHEKAFRAGLRAEVSAMFKGK